TDANGLNGGYLSQLNDAIVAFNPSGPVMLAILRLLNHFVATTNYVDHDVRADFGIRLNINADGNNMAAEAKNIDDFKNNAAAPGQAVDIARASQSVGRIPGAAK